MKSSALIACLILGWIQSFGQSIQRDRVIFTLNSKQVRAILNDHAELVMRREQSRIDSTAYQAMFRAFLYKDSAYQASKQALLESDRVGQDWHQAYTETEKLVNQSKKEIRRQKRWKIAAFAVAGIVLIFR